ncbi:hypothetical protein HPP92_023619 [Vanilla planifolia]|uniref:[RNA-polymerase]-subunit kinase n=1 Tax=Vanilla planifolia TaxID=51239 RepID=A0A835PVU2_VANPL|nr:hypothetical protein HPP92_023619 [Vanilla planifolia]
MGCAASKKAVSVTPVLDSSGILRSQPRSEVVLENSVRPKSREEKEGNSVEQAESGKASLNSPASVTVRLGNLHKYIEGEQVAAGWPAWLTTFAGEAIYGWIPLKADNFQKLDKVGQGTYSTVFKARELETGKVVALKKVRFDNFEPESVRFMAREIQILRKLDHPNVMKLEGLITSRLSCSIYLVFEYMEHDLAGLSSSPDIKFTEEQVKCYMQQLLSGLQHCHSHGIIHRDIKGANLLVSNEGVLKIADFGLANFKHPENKLPLTSRVVYIMSCLSQKPILQGRTEVICSYITLIPKLNNCIKFLSYVVHQQKSTEEVKLPHATIFKPHRPYENHLHETFRNLQQSAYKLLEIFLSVEPQRRGTAASALASEYFKTKPFAYVIHQLCPNTHLPKRLMQEVVRMHTEYAVVSYDAATCRRRIPKVAGRARAVEVARRPLRVHRDPQDSSGSSRLSNNTETESNMNNNATDSSNENSRNSGCVGREPPTAIRAKVTSDIDNIAEVPAAEVALELPEGIEQHRIMKTAMLKNWAQLECPRSFDSTSTFHSQCFTREYHDEGERVEFSGPLLNKSHKVDELLKKHERQIRQAVRRSWFQRVAGRKVK